MDDSRPVLAVDIGGTKLAAGLVEPGGRVLTWSQVPTPTGVDAEQMWRTLDSLITKVLDGAEVGPADLAGCGCGCGGPMQWPAGLVSPLNIPAWRGFPLRSRLAERLPGIPVRVHNDAICMVAGEHWRGAGRGRDNVMGVVVSTGVGGGLVLDGRLIAGASGNAGHIGHVVVDPDTGPVCECGGRGCTEAIARGPALVAWAQAEGWRPDQKNATAKELADDGALGHPIGLAAMRRAGRALGIAIASAAALCDLDVVSVGGGLSQAGPLLFDPLEEHLRAHARLEFIRDISVVPAALGQSAGLVGAAALIFAADQVLVRGLIDHWVVRSVDRARCDNPGVTSEPLPVGPDDVLAARDLLRPVIRRTPLLESGALSALVGGPVFLKCENLQRAGSFKVRGAYVRIARLSAAERARGVVAASAGNHAQGVALAAGWLGARATVVMPAAAPLPKIAATRSYGADVVLHGVSVEQALAKARELAEETGSVFIHPFDHPDVVAGQGSAGLEIAEQCPQARTVVVPVGGGGLCSGLAVALSAMLPGAQVIGVQAEAMAPVPASITARPVSVAPSSTMADGIAVATPGDLTIDLMTRLGVRVLTVTEENLSRALLLCLERSKQLAEPAGAAGVAALLEHPAHLFEPPVVVVLSGGNIDPLLLSKVLRHGLSAAGRYMAFRCKLPDRPGALATLLGELAALGANVLDVMHERVTADLRVDEAEVNLHLETRGPEHCETVISQLRKAGYTLLFS